LHIDGISLNYAPPKFSEIAGAPVTTDIGYSLAEQDTGITWVDGKKVYKRTFKDVSVVSSSTAGQTVNIQLIPAGVIDTYIKSEGICVLPSGNNTMYPLSDSDRSLKLSHLKNAGGNLSWQFRSDHPSETLIATVTVYYTKL
jgi:hypothetical protein